jgi:hypothetical protein
MNLKQELKDLASDIRQKKSQRKELKGFVPGLDHARYQARHIHVAYSLLKGNALEDIERNPTKDLDKAYVQKIMEAYNEALRISLQEAQ